MIKYILNFSKNTLIPQKYQGTIMFAFLISFILFIFFHSSFSLFTFSGFFAFVIFADVYLTYDNFKLPIVL
jgi:hypothetical protein